jgi:flagellar biosynthesis anti-sigma factor FlgM
MNQEQSTSDANANAATGLMETQAAPIAPTGATSDARAAQACDARFSSLEARVEHLEGLALKTPDFRLAKVLELKAQINAGTYDVPALQVADALLDYMRRWAA